MIFCRKSVDETVVQMNMRNPNTPAGGDSKDLAEVQMCDNPAYQEISRFPSENMPHIYEMVPL